MNCTNFPLFFILLLPLSYRLLCQVAYFYLSMWYLMVFLVTTTFPVITVQVPLQLLKGY